MKNILMLAALAAGFTASAGVVFSDPVNLNLPANGLAGRTIVSADYELHADFSDARVVDAVLSGTDLRGNEISATLTPSTPVYAGTFASGLPDGENRLVYTFTYRDSGANVLAVVTNEIWRVPSAGQPMTLLTDPSDRSWQRTRARFPVPYATDWADFPATNAVLSVTSGATHSETLPTGSGWVLCEFAAAGLTGPQYAYTLTLDDPFETVWGATLRRFDGFILRIR